MKKATLLILLLTFYLNGICQYNRVSFYVVADPDQWQLFMGLAGYDDLVMTDDVAKNKVVFIYVTAGDESCDGKHPNRTAYTARQASAHSTVEFCADKTHPHCQLATNTDTVMGHTIEKSGYNNVTSYFLRLPDRCNGHSLFGQGLQQLHDGAVSSIMAVDSSATYNGWSDLAGTVQQIMVNEQRDIDFIYVNTADTDVVLNKGDEGDHIYAGKLCTDALAATPHYSMNLYQENIIASLPSNVDDIAIATKAALLSQLDYTRTENGLPSKWTPVNISYLSRDYFRTVTR